MAPELEEFIRDTLQRHEVITLATIRPDGYPRAASVGYVSDGLTLYVLAGAEAEKIADIRRCAKVSLTIQRAYEDWHKIAGLTIAATAQVIGDAAEIARVLAMFIAKYPTLAELLPTLARDEIVVVRLRPKTVALVENTLDIGGAEIIELWEDAA